MNLNETEHEELKFIRLAQDRTKQQVLSVFKENYRPWS
jgi:hypothetical protein